MKPVLQCAIGCLLSLMIQPADTYSADGSVLEIRVFDSMTGKAIIPGSIELVPADVSRKITLHDFSPPGRAVMLEKGEWKLTVNARDFHSLASHVRVGELHSVQFYLDPMQPPAELEENRILSLHRPDATLIAGYAVDDETGTPIANALVRTNAGEVRTNAEGYFQTYIALSHPAGSAVAAQTIFFSQEQYQTECHKNIEVWENGDWIYRIRMKPGRGVTTIDESKAGRAGNEQDAECESCNSRSGENLLSTVVMPSSIRVGRNCTGTSCTTVEVYSLETYVKRVLPAEWYSCWGSLANGMNSLQAGAVAIRSYGLWYVYHPLSSTYDICDNTSCQAFGSTTSTNANNAVDATTRYILTDAAQANVQRSEYSAENNNSGCGDGFTGTGSSWPCISDQPCLGQTRNGHGRGMCQWGSIRWANGTRVLTTAPCSQGISHGQGTMPWQQILSHYYPGYTLTQGEAATIQSVAVDPANVSQGSTFTIQYSIDASASFAVMLAASIAPAGTTTYTSDPARDVKVTLAQGANSIPRSFVVPAAQPTGAHDLLVALWYDKNNNNTIDAGDFVINSQQYNNALTVTILPVQLVSFTATRINGNDVRLDWRTTSEINNYGFFMQRKAETGGVFADLPNSFIAGHGTTNEPHDYSFTDRSVPPGRWLYRLRQVELDGTPHFTDPIQIEITTGLAERTPAEFHLYQNYPNPFNPATNFQFSIDNSQLTILKVFDLLGRDIATLVNERLSAGVHSVSWNASGFPSGVYSYRLTSGGRSETRRLVLLR